MTPRLGRHRPGLVVAYLVQPGAAQHRPDHDLHLVAVLQGVGVPPQLGGQVIDAYDAEDERLIAEEKVAYAALRDAVLAARW